MRILHFFPKEDCMISEYVAMLHESMGLECSNEMVTDAVENILWYLKLNKNDIPVIACSYYEGTTGQRGELEHLKIADGLSEYVLYQEPEWEEKLKELIEKYGKSS